MNPAEMPKQVVSHFQIKRKILRWRRKKLERRQEEDKSKAEIEQLEQDRNIIRKGISIAKSYIDKGNTEIGEVMKAKFINS